MKFEKIKNWPLFLLPLFVLVYFILFKITDTYNYHVFIAEDGPVEYAQFILFLLAGIFFLASAINLLKKKTFLVGFCYLLFSFAAFFVAIEEISWGQRLLQIDTPEMIAQQNSQNEITIHNLDYFQQRLPQAYMLIGLWGALGWMIVTKINKK
ncbi:MAG: hypothetical protein PHX72_01700, partial [Candidatus Shapirobacteria bacterium]|nr:hypothetical protein [Candidatus Shapirobacteria bacterium]